MIHRNLLLFMGGGQSLKNTFLLYQRWRIIWELTILELQIAGCLAGNQVPFGLSPWGCPFDPRPSGAFFSFHRSFRLGAWQVQGAGGRPDSEMLASCMRFCCPSGRPAQSHEAILGKAETRRTTTPHLSCSTADSVSRLPCGAFRSFFFPPRWRAKVLPGSRPAAGSPGSRVADCNQFGTSWLKQIGHRDKYPLPSSWRKNEKQQTTKLAIGERDAIGNESYGMSPTKSIQLVVSFKGTPGFIPSFPAEHQQEKGYQRLAKGFVQREGTNLRLKFFELFSNWSFVLFLDSIITYRRTPTPAKQVLTNPV